MKAADLPLLTDIAAVDLGSNSFHLQMARVVDDQLFMHDSLREVVRLGAGLDQNKMLSQDAIQRAVACLRRFGERLRGLDPHGVRAVATNTFRVARNAGELLERAQHALGFPIEIIAGREEARMIFLGVSHSLPPYAGRRLVVDIGGGSTEFIIGQAFEPQQMESLYMGCVSYSLRFFSDGKLSEDNLRRAEIAARTEIQSIRHGFYAGHWQEAVGSSGTARALGEMMRLNGISDGTITRSGLAELKAWFLKAKDVRKLNVPGLSEERKAVIAGGFAIMTAAFAELGIERMTVASGALREGVLYELLGRMHHQDTREVTVRQFQRRYHVDGQQARRVQALALDLLEQIAPRLEMEWLEARQYLSWAARLHEIGISIAHPGYHKHSAYIIENADMPGFSRRDQQILSLLLRAQRRALTKLPKFPTHDDHWALIMILRLAVLFHRNRMDVRPPRMRLDWNDSRRFVLKLEENWLKNNPLTEAELTVESAYWKDVGFSLILE
ncbi:MAG: exopolyphosphatase [Methylophilaceae bacterium]|nr:exopolyphosphatase [Methylophilaceae bacterium]